MNASEIIDKLGGTAEVARICEVKPPSVSEWRTAGIPPARLMYLKVIKPEVFANRQPEKAAASARSPALPRTLIVLLVSASNLSSTTLLNVLVIAHLLNLN